MKKFIIYVTLLLLTAFSVYSWGITDTAKEFEYSHIQNVEIKGRLFDITVKGKDISSVIGKIETSNKNYMLYHKQEGDSLVIWFEKPWWAIFSYPGKHKLSMQVPVSTNIYINNRSGKVDVKNIKAKEVILKTSSGKIITENIKANQKFQSNSGKIIVNKTGSPEEIIVSTRSGNINIEGADAGLKVRTSSGKIRITDAPGRKTLNSSSGNIIVSSSTGNIVSYSNSGKQIFKKICGNIKARTSSGNINIEDVKGFLELNTNSGSIKGENITILADSSFKTSSGKISIDYTNSFEDFTFDLTARSGKLKAGSICARKELCTGNGSIKITGISSSGNQFYK